ncbi:MAG: hypothetical protein P9L91_06455 [Candidatus Zophobacter franzmannii]|nr:hypothetical protein [Candidatus Zophobacter franzmannii]
MISLEWKERLSKDVNDFFINKLPQKNYDIEIVYNVYPIRVHNTIPREVITFVAKELGTKLNKNREAYLDFYNTLWDEKGDNGQIIMAYLFAKFIKKSPDFFLPIVEAKLEGEDTPIENLLLEKTILPLIKDKPEKYLPLIFKWLKRDDADLQLHFIKLLVKYCKSEPDHLSEILEKIKYSWLLGSDASVKSGTFFLKQVASMNEEIYLSFFEANQKTHDPSLVEVMCGSLTSYYAELEPIINQWTKSGNARLKRAALTGQKLLKRKGKQIKNG